MSKVLWMCEFDDFKQGHCGDCIRLAMKAQQLNGAYAEETWGYEGDKDENDGLEWCEKDERYVEIEVDTHNYDDIPF